MFLARGPWGGHLFAQHRFSEDFPVARQNATYQVQLLQSTVVLAVIAALAGSVSLAPWHNRSEPSPRNRNTLAQARRATPASRPKPRRRHGGMCLGCGFRAPLMRKTEDFVRTSRELETLRPRKQVLRVSGASGLDRGRGHGFELRSRTFFYCSDAIY
jgi:hypothetical protein